MKRMVLFFFLLHFGLFVFCQQEKELLRESVEVVNVEVPVRVYYKGKLVDDLTRADFKLYENRKLQEIKGFICKRKKIKVQEVEMTAEQKKTLAPRYFTLVFRIQYFNDDLKHVEIDHLSWFLFPLNRNKTIFFKHTFRVIAQKNGYYYK